MDIDFDVPNSLIILLYISILEISIWVLFSIIFKGNPQGGKAVSIPILNAFVCFSGMFFPWNTVSTKGFHNIRYYIPSFWVSTCLSNTLHGTKSNWGCHDSDEIECLGYDSLAMIDGYGLDHGDCFIAGQVVVGYFILSMIASAAAFWIGIRTISATFQSSKQDSMPSDLNVSSNLDSISHDVILIAETPPRQDGMHGAH